MSPDLLMQVCLRSYLSQAKQIPGKHRVTGSEIWVFRDPSGLEFMPYNGYPRVVSVGKRRHDLEMTTGYPKGVKYPKDQTKDFDDAACNMSHET